MEYLYQTQTITSYEDGHAVAYKTTIYAGYTSSPKWVIYHDLNVDQLPTMTDIQEFIERHTSKAFSDANDSITKLPY